MRSLWQRWRDPLGLHARLSERRSRARPEFVSQLADELSESRRTAPRLLRLALAGALTLMMLVAAGTVGGAGYAASAAGSVANAVTGISGDNQAVLASDDDPDDDQYEEEREECERAVQEAHEQFHAEQSSGHLAFHSSMQIALEECEELGGGDDDDDD